MVDHLSDEWFALRAEVEADLPTVEGVDLRVQRVVTKAPGGDVSYVLHVRDGRVTSVSSGPDGGADVTLTTPYPLAVDLLRGDVTLDVGFMRGQVKFAGDMGAFLRWLPLTVTDEAVAARARLAEATDL